MSKKVEKPKAEVSALTTVDPFESIVDAPAARKKAAAPRKPRVAKAAKPAKAEGAFAETAEKTVEQVRKIKVIKAKDRTPEIVQETVEAAEAPALQKVKKAAAAKKPVKAAASKKTEKPVKAKAATAKRSKSQKKKPAIDTAAEPIVAPLAAEAPIEVERSRAFNILADVELPKRPRQNRARLLMQSPTKLYFYWSLREDPWQQLHKAFGEHGSAGYMLVLKLKDLARDVEEMHRVEREGNWWFEVEPDGKYTAEIGFYSPSRPYFRVVYSNQIATPRRGPSLQPARDADWRISANKFAQVLDVSGFQRDAFDVAMVGDDHFGAMDRSERALAGLIGKTDLSFNGISPEDIRYALLSLATGTPVKQLKDRVGSALFNLLSASGTDLEPDAARAALSEHFEVDETDWAEEEPEFTSLGGSRVNFPKRLRARRLPAYSPRYNPVSSFALR
ncbi:MAG TPA: DUF4912 domain-containing protein [Pyrinomonadaceae bacterium]|nr:DUF4912 domain-containing protein [Pyrinomonadaceae bacterium]